MAALALPSLLFLQVSLLVLQETRQNPSMFGVGRDLCGHPAQPPAEAGSPRAGCTGPCPGGSGISPEKETPQPPWAGLCQTRQNKIQTRINSSEAFATEHWGPCTSKRVKPAVIPEKGCGNWRFPSTESAWRGEPAAEELLLGQGLLGVAAGVSASGSKPLGAPSSSLTRRATGIDFPR